MNIKITESNTAKISAALAAINGKSLAHTYAASEILILAEHAEAKLAALVSKKYMAGATVFARSGDALPNAYKYSRAVNRITIERRSSAWYLTGIEHSQAYKDAGYLHLCLTQAQDLMSVQLHRAKYSINAPANPHAESPLTY